MSKTYEDWTGIDLACGIEVTESGGRVRRLDRMDLIQLCKDREIPLPVETRAVELKAAIRDHYLNPPVEGEGEAA